MYLRLRQRPMMASALWLLVFSALARPALAQTPASAAAGVHAVVQEPVALRAQFRLSEPAPTGTALLPMSAFDARQPIRADSSPSPWWAPVASAVLPGSGQFALRQERSVAYLVADGYLLVQFLVTRRDANNERNSYRSIANEVARQQFGGVGINKSWDYYEILENYLESGAYDRIPGGAIDPETNPDTYNGHRWLQARETYWFDPEVAPPVDSPEYRRALAFYLRYAVTEDFRWSWRDAQLQQDVYRQAIRSANRSYQRAVNYLGLVAMNHLASMIDAYVSVRVRRYGSVGGLSVARIQTRVVPVGDPAEGRNVWQAGLTLAR
ncbi:MAG: hypothetical protein IBJ03_12785 [Gemmatimonadaceae bacterium]|nr:hypothetical protein [Gemmatimonadaceae bacterium]